jgi:hypothetical protein
MRRRRRMGWEWRSSAQSPVSSNQDGKQQDERLAQSFVRFGRALGAGMAAFFEQVTPLAGRLYAALWDAYRNAGAPYGETSEGLNRWVQEQVESMRTAARRARARQMRQVRPGRENGAG